jgi:hypothetical protein
MGGHATNHHLRRLRNLAVKLGWLMCPVVAKAVWPKVVAHQRRAVTPEEHAMPPVLVVWLVVLQRGHARESVEMWRTMP